MPKMKTHLEQVPLEVVTRRLLKKKPSAKNRPNQTEEPRRSWNNSSWRQAGTMGKANNMSDMLDVFRVETSGVRWLESAATLEDAKTRVQEFAVLHPVSTSSWTKKPETNSSSISMAWDRAPVGRSDR
jgi:hypothetical protein